MLTPNTSGNKQIAAASLGAKGEPSMSILVRLVVAIMGGLSIMLTGAAVCAVYNTLNEVQGDRWIVVFLFGTLTVLVIDSVSKRHGH
jgi:hypothetical protein